MFFFVSVIQNCGFADMKSNVQNGKAGRAISARIYPRPQCGFGMDFSLTRPSWFPP